MSFASAARSKFLAADARRSLAFAVGLGAAVFVITCISIGTHSPEADAPLICLADGVVLAALLRSRMRAWAAMLIFAFISELGGFMLRGDPLMQDLGITTINAVEVLACAGLLRRLCGPAIDLTRWRDLAVFGVVAGLAAPIGSTLMSAGWSKAFGGEASLSLPIMGLRAAADSLGFIVMTPAFLTFGQVRSELMARPFKTVDCALLAILAGVTSVVLTDGHQGLIFIIPTLLLLVTLHTGRLGAALGILSITVIGLAFIMGDSDRPHLISNSTQRLAIIQAFLAVCAVSTTPVAALMTQRRGMAASLQTAKAAIEEAHAESLEQRRWVELAAGAAGVGYWRLDVRRNKITWSDEVYRMFGQVPGQPPKLEAAMAMVHPLDKTGADAKVHLALTTGQGYRASTRILHPNGDVCYTLGQALCELGPDGAVIALMGAMYDITELKLTENALAESEAKYRGMANNATDVLAGYRADGTFTYLSPAIRQVLGFAPEELIGRKTFDIMHMDDVDAAKAQFQAYVDNPRSGPPKIQYRAWHKDGRILWLEAHPRAFYGPDGVLVEFQDVVRDITDRKATEAALEAARVMAEFRAGGRLRA